jgi:hypothetical protein
VHGIEPGELTLGSDNGSAFTARRFRARLGELGIRHRRGGYRDPESQAFIESWFGKLKEREVWLNEYETLDDARRGIGGYVDRYHHRPHSSLNYRTPLEVRQTWEDLPELQNRRPSLSTPAGSRSRGLTPPRSRRRPSSAVERQRTANSSRTTLLEVAPPPSGDRSRSEHADVRVDLPDGVRGWVLRHQPSGVADGLELIREIFGVLGSTMYSIWYLLCIPHSARRRCCRLPSPVRSRLGALSYGWTRNVITRRSAFVSQTDVSSPVPRRSSLFVLGQFPHGLERSR